jgi:16S rRNA (cytidine1402-2'-O)-methyltransferase
MTIYLLPNLFDETQPWELFLPESVKETVATLDGLIAESEKAGRRYLRRFVDHDRMAATPIRLLNEHTPPSEIAELLAPIVDKGENWGLVSDAGLPCIADPGSPLVLLAHEKKVQLVTFPGPSSILMALQLSGLCGQRFTFHGYLPRELPDLKRSLQQLEVRSKQDKSAQIWIEAPYRSGKMASISVESLEPSTLFCIALDLTFSTQSVRTQTIMRWRKETVEIGKRPAVFLLQS